MNPLQLNKYRDSNSSTEQLHLRELQRTELELVSASSCCVCLSCWHPINLFDRTPYP